MTTDGLATAATPRVFDDAIDHAVRAIPPAWPLASSVAVNPFLGQTGETLAAVAARLARIAGVAVTMPRSWYLAKLEGGAILDEDLIGALSVAPLKAGLESASELRLAAARPSPAPEALPTVADLAAASSWIDWPGFIAGRIGAFAGDYFDEGQAVWAAPKGRGLYAAWRAAATHDLSPEICGLKGFAQHVYDAPETARAAITRATERLGLAPAGAQGYFHQLLSTLGGWAQYGRYRLWQAELVGGVDDAVVDLLAVRLIWEEALFLNFGPFFRDQWDEVAAAHAGPIEPSNDQIIDAVLQDAAERAGQRALAALLADTESEPFHDRPKLQAAFCIDVRSEVFRRALESVDPAVQTLGFAGFFGLTTQHRRFASDVAEKRLPVLINPALRSVAGDAGLALTDQAARIHARAKRAWGRFKLAAVSSFAFVEATGPLYVGKLVVDALALVGGSENADPAPRFDPALDLPEKLDIAENVLRAMSLTRNFAPVVVLAGHGANVVNNPHASALHCGACGGYSGEVNARLLASLLNDEGVRAGLVMRDVIIPDDTLFVAALHDTTTDQIRLFVDEQRSDGRRPLLDQVRVWFALAGRMARTERAMQLPRADTEARVKARSRDWSETRPEWGLAGCRAFIAAPRRRTLGKPLAGRAFLHDYDWEQDSGFGVLELILTAPVVVASWISLQYYGSTVAPELFGAGNKLLHNVTGGIGVVEGNGGVLRTGLPWQSVHDGATYVHEPLRLSVCIEVPREAMSDILGRHPEVRALFDNGWMHLFALDERGHMAWRYSGELGWEAVNAGVENRTTTSLALAR